MLPAARPTTGHAQLRLDDEAFYLAVDGDRIDVTAGSAPHADLTLRTDPITLTRPPGATSTPGDALTDGTLELEGRPGALDDFLGTFTLRSRA